MYIVRGFEFFVMLVLNFGFGSEFEIEEVIVVWLDGKIFKVMVFKKN